jgi:hypothetical protein
MVLRMKNMPYNLRRTLVSQTLGDFMHWFKLLLEGWVVFGIVAVAAGSIWTTRLSREMNPEISKAPPLPETQFETAA